MHKIANVSRLIIIGIPGALLLTLVLLARSVWFGAHPEALSIGITVDLLLTVPLVYYLLIRKTDVPKTTVVPFLIVGAVIGTWILPLEHQHLLSLAKQWILPAAELFVVGYVVYNVRQGFLSFKEQKKVTFDFFTALKATCTQLLPRWAVMPVVTEMAVFYYGLLHWRRRVPQEHEFTHHKRSGTVALLLVVLLLVVAETFVFHILLSLWSSTAAWLLTALSIYSGIQLFGFLRSLPKRPHAIEDGQLKLRYGILSEAFVDLDKIQHVELSSRAVEMTPETKHLSPLGSLEQHNVVIQLKEASALNGLYGVTKEFKTLLLFVDEAERFKKNVEEAIAVS